MQAVISDAHAGRRNLLASLSDDELSPAALAARVVLADVARDAGGAKAAGPAPPFTRTEDPLAGSAPFGATLQLPTVPSYQEETPA